MSLTGVAVFFCSIALLLFGHYVGVILHELGHFACARAIGWKPTRIAIGLGHILGTWQIGELKVTFGARFSGGLVQAYPLERDWFRLKLFFFAAAGPLATALFCGGLWWILFASRWLREGSTLQGVLGWLLIAEGCWLIVNLWPHMIQIEKRLIPNDGLAMGMALWTRRQALDQRFAGGLMDLARRYWEQSRFTEAKALVERAFRSCGGSSMQSHVFFIEWLSAHGDLEEAGAEWDRLEESVTGSETESIDTLDGLACLPLRISLPSLLPRALRTIERAIELEGARVTLRGTKGSLLIEAGQIEEGERLLEQVVTVSHSETDQAICATYLALAQFKKGATKEAIELLSQAREKYPQKSELTARAEKTIRGEQNANSAA